MYGCEFYVVVLHAVTNNFGSWEVCHRHKAQLQALPDQWCSDLLAAQISSLPTSQQIEIHDFV